MRINSNQGVSQGQQIDFVRNDATTQAGKPLEVSNSTSSDQASLSADATQLSNLSLALTNVPDVRQERVQAVSSAIQSGNYALSNQQIAGAMLRDFRMTSTLTQ